MTTTTTTTTNTAGAIAAVIPTLLPILKVNCSPRLINGDGDEAALLLPQRFQLPIGDDCNLIHSIANVDDISTGQIFDVNNVGEANEEYEQQRSLTLTRTTTTNNADAIVAVIPPLVPFFEVNNVSKAQANQGHTLKFNYAGQANQEYEQQRGLMTMMTTKTNTAGGIVTVIPPLLPFFRVNDVSQVQANQECQQHMSTTTTMTSVAIAVTTPPISPPAVIQPVLPLAPNNGQNDIQSPYREWELSLNVFKKPIKNVCVFNLKKPSKNICVCVCSVPYKLSWGV